MSGARARGLDVLRVLALGLVVLAHVIVVARLSWPSAVLGLDWGQLGVAGFCVMAGFFAVGGERRLGEWAAERVLRLFPAYWLVTIAGFAGNAVIGYKPATLGLFVSQMLGIGYFTHGGANLVNVPAWFLSLIVACYVLAALVRAARAPRLTLAALVVTTAVLVAVGYRADFTRQILVFLVGMGIRLTRFHDAPRAVRLAAGLLAPCVVLVSTNFGYTGWAVAAFLAFAAWPAPAWRPVSFVSDYSYELFLVHGPIVVLVARLVGMPAWLALLAGVAAALAAAVALRLVTRRVTLLALGGGSAPAVRRAGAAVALLVLLPAVAAAEVGGLSALPKGEAPGPNLLKNGGFDGGAAGWSRVPDGDAWAVEDGGRSGASLRLTGAVRQKVVPSAEQAVTLQPGLYTVEGWVRTRDLGVNAERSGVRVCLDGRPRLQWWQCTDVARGTRDWTLLRQGAIAVRQAGQYRVSVEAYGTPDGTAWFDDVSLTQIGRPPLDAYLLYPNFRGLLFDDKPQTVRVALTPSAAKDVKARIRIALVDDGGGAVRRQREYEASGPVTGELDAADLPAGAYRLRAELLDAAGGAVYHYPEYRIVKLPAKARQKMNVWVDEHNVTHLGGKPAFVLGIYNTSGYSTSPDSYARGDDGWGNDRISQAPFNMIINYFLGAAPIDALTAYMDDLARRSMFYLHTVNFYYRDDPLYAKLPYPAAKDGEDAVNRWIAKTLSKHPALAGFYTADERPADMVPKVFRQHRELAAGATGTVDYVVLGDGWEDQAPLWRDAADVLGLDPYPIRKKPGQNELAMAGEWTRLGREAVMGSRPLWMVMQYFPLTSEGGWPRYEDQRAMSWMAIIEGARGLFYWSFGSKGLAWVKDTKAREQKWAELVRLTKEIKALEPVLLAPDAALVTRESSGGAIRSLGKRMPDGTRYLFAYNVKNAPASVTWTLAAAAGEITDLDGRPAPKVDGANVTVEFAPYEVKRYRMR